MLPALHRALTDGDLRPLPSSAADVLTDLAAPPRLAAHLRAVHDVAVRLTAALDVLGADAGAVHYGAATHDIGKVLHVAELSGPGTAHEPAGRALLLERGVPERLARFAGSHGGWSAESPVEDLLVSLADKVWKGARVPDLEDLVVDRLAPAAGAERWQAFLDLDDVLGGLAAGADERLAFQASHPVHG